ncbi:MAG TPA: EI24 domain-containing protein, partial [Polyangia bacterium]
MIARFFRGMGYFGRGWRVAFGSLRVLPFVLLPAALTFTVASLGALLALRKGFALVEGLFGKHGDVVGALVHILVWIVVVAAFFLFYVAASFVATAPFAGFISERTEAVRTGQPVPPQSLARA